MLDSGWAVHTNNDILKHPKTKKMRTRVDRLLPFSTGLM